MSRFAEPSLSRKPPAEKNKSLFGWVPAGCPGRPQWKTNLNLDGFEPTAQEARTGKHIVIGMGSNWLSSYPSGEVFRRDDLSDCLVAVDCRLLVCIILYQLVPNCTCVWGDVRKHVVTQQLSCIFVSGCSNLDLQPRVLHFGRYAVQNWNF